LCTRIGRMLVASCAMMISMTLAVLKLPGV
jgi:hypothetical protein